MILQTGSLYILWTPYVVSFAIPAGLPWKQMLIIDRVVGFNSWVQPIIYLLTNPEARGLCLKAIRQCRQKLRLIIIIMIIITGPFIAPLLYENTPLRLIRSITPAVSKPP